MNWIPKGNGDTVAFQKINSTQSTTALELLFLPQTIRGVGVDMPGSLFIVKASRTSALSRKTGKFPNRDMFTEIVFRMVLRRTQTARCGIVQHVLGGHICSQSHRQAFLALQVSTRFSKFFGSSALNLRDNPWHLTASSAFPHLLALLILLQVL